MLWSMVSNAAERSSRQRHILFVILLHRWDGRECRAFPSQWNDVYSRQTGED